MTSTLCSDGKAVSPAIVDSVKATIDNTYSAFFSEKPVLATNSVKHTSGPCIAGIISFLGDESWSLAWILHSDTAPNLAMRFAGFEVPFDSPDMGDLAGELVNVIAGEIIAQMEKRKIKVSMSLPTVARGCPLQLIPETGPTIVLLEYKSKEGIFWFRIASAKNCQTRLPGK